MASATEAIPIMAGHKAHAWVAEMDAGEFVSHVEIDGDHSFTVINGPSGDWDTVMGWARTVASEVTVRIGERVFAAGSATSERLPAVPPVSADAPPAGRHAVSDRADFEVRAALAWPVATREALTCSCARACRRRRTGAANDWRVRAQLCVRGHDGFDAGWTARHSPRPARGRARRRGGPGGGYSPLALG